MLKENLIYSFFSRLDDCFDGICSGVLQIRPFPSIKQAYTKVRREALRHAVMTADYDSSSSAILVTKGL